MAGQRALEAVAKTVVDVLTDARPTGWGIEVALALAGTIADPPLPGVTVLAHRIAVDGTVRHPQPPVDPVTGRRALPQLPVDLHLLVTAHAEEPGPQLAVAGWALRTLADRPLLDAATLNRSVDAAFDDGEAVELLAADVAQEDLLRLWEALGDSPYQLSVPYLARGIRIDSGAVVEEHPLVTERHLRFGVVGRP